MNTRAMPWSSVGEHERSSFMHIAYNYYKLFLRLTNSSIVDIDSFVKNQCLGTLELILDSEDTPFDSTLIAVLIASFKILVEVNTDDDICTPEVVLIINKLYEIKRIVIKKEDVYEELNIIIDLLVHENIRLVY
jgi:hypothetical protein